MIHIFSIKLPTNLYNKLEKMCEKRKVSKLLLIASLLDAYEDDRINELPIIPRFVGKSTIELSQEKKQKEKQKRKEKKFPQTEKPKLLNHVDLSRYER